MPNNSNNKPSIGTSGKPMPSALGMTPAKRPQEANNMRHKLAEGQRSKAADSARKASSDKTSKESSGKGRRGKTAIIVISCIVAALAVWLCIWLFACNGENPFDTNAQTGQAPYKTQEEMQAELNRKVEEGMFNISIASAIDFDSGEGTGTAYIENIPGNNYMMQVSITLDDTGEELYRSGVLKPNQYIEKISLSRDLPPGNYPATATFTALDGDTFDEVGTAAAKVTLNVLS